MIYPYRCPICCRETDVLKPVQDAGKAEACPDCGMAMDRVFTAPALNFATLTLREKVDLRDHQLRTGSEAIPMGNDRPKSFQPKAEDYTLPSEVMARLEG